MAAVFGTEFRGGFNKFVFRFSMEYDIKSVVKKSLLKLSDILFQFFFLTSKSKLI